MYSIINLYSVNIGGYSKNTFSQISIQDLIVEIKKNTLNKPFIICLQEVTDKQIDVIRNKRHNPYNSVTAMQANPSKDASGKKYYSYNAVLISDDFEFTGIQVPTQFFQGGRSTNWCQIKHKESQSVFEICSLHAKISTSATDLSLIISELLDTHHNRILCGDFNVRFAKLLDYTRNIKDGVYNYLAKIDKSLSLGKNTDFIFTDAANLEIVNFNNNLNIQVSKKIPHSVICAQIILNWPTPNKIGGIAHYLSKYVRFILY